MFVSAPVIHHGKSNNALSSGLTETPGYGMKHHMIRRSLALLCALLVAATFTSGIHAAGAIAGSTAADFPMYLGNLARTNYAGAEATLTPQNVGTITPRWQTAPGSPVSAQPVIWHSDVFWGAWDGYERATTTSGRSVWSTYLGQTDTPRPCPSKRLGIASTSAVATFTINRRPTPILFVGGGDAKLYALDAITGEVVWSKRLGPKGSSFIWSSPAVFDGNVYIGLASVGDCPLIGGKVFEIGPRRGIVSHVFDTTPTGCIGAGVWGSVTVDVQRQRLYFATGNANSCGKRTLGESIVELQAGSLALVGSWTVPLTQQFWDTDFGSTPTLFTAHTAKGDIPMVGVVNKNGIYYAFRRDDLGAGPVWQLKIGVGGSRPDLGTGDISPAAWNGSTLFVGGGVTTISGAKCPGSLRALNPVTGAIIWQDCLPGHVLGAPVVTNALVEIGAGASVLVVSSTTGAILFHHTEPNATFWGSASISNGTFYIGNMSGHLYFVAAANWTAGKTASDRRIRSW